jgi:hypothetical protein
MQSFYFKNLSDTKSIFLGGGVPNISYLWLLPIIDGYCENNNIKTLIFESNLPKKFFKVPITRKILKKYNLIFPFKRNFNFYLFFLLYFFKSLKLFFWCIFVKKNLILNKNNTNIKTYLYHSIWDTSFQSKGEFLYPNIISKSVSATRVIYKMFIADVLIMMNIKAAFMIHTVYHHRMLLFKLLNKKIKVFAENGFSYLIQYRSFYDNYNIVEKKYLNKLSIKFLKNKNIVNQYWNLRLKGKGNRDETYTPPFKKIDFYKDYISNVIMLPIIKDSQFAHIDKNRIFIDCIDWLKYTLNVINASEEKWIIKPHPSMKVWGEDTKKVIDLLIINNIGNYKNIKYVEDISNHEVFLNAKRIITFNGTSQIESGCYGVKPIAISRTDYNYYNSNLVLIPKTLIEYKKLLLISSDSYIFKLDKKYSIYCKFFIFFKEKVISLSEEIGRFTELRNSSKRIKKNNFYLVLGNVKKNYKHLIYIGSLLGRNLNITFSKKYIKYLNNI